MRIAELAQRRDRLHMALAGTSLAVLLLTIALALCALRARPILIVPGAKSEGVITPGEVPDAAAIHFALNYVYQFDNYTPATIEAATQALKTHIAARAWTEVSEALDRRAGVIREGRMASHLAALFGGRVERAKEGVLKVSLEGTRRVYIADRLSRESLVRYQVVIEPCAPTPGNPHGLAVVSQTVEEVIDASRG